MSGIALKDVLHHETTVYRSELKMALKLYDYEFVTEPDDSLICSICLEVAKEPKQEVVCGKLFCNECVEKNGNNPCPSCKTKQPQYFNDKRSKISLLLSTI